MGGHLGTGPVRCQACSFHQHLRNVEEGSRWTLRFAVKQPARGPCSHPVSEHSVLGIGIEAKQHGHSRAVSAPTPTCIQKAA